MPLIQLWEKSPDIFLEYNIRQLVSFAGDGVLSDSSTCSQELRQYLRAAPPQKLFEYVSYCLANPFEKSGFVLQDLINELGRRLDYEVEDGFYQGRTNQIGNDGLWIAPNGHSVIVEIKTTDAYRINLDTVAAYRTKLINAQKITEKSSILIIVGRHDTGDLEAQIRGSRHAWDARIISTEALVKLVELKVKSDEDETVDKIRSLLVPFEYTRLDNIIDVMFTAAKDVETGVEESEHIADDNVEGTQDDYQQAHTPRSILENVRAKAINALGKRESLALITHKRSQFWSADKKLRAVCPVSKLYPTGYYWYAFHPTQQTFLAEAQQGFLTLACIDHPYAYAIPYSEIEEIIPFLNKTEKEGRHYWHIHLQPVGDGSYQLVVPRKDPLNLEAYKLSLDKAALSKAA